MINWKQTSDKPAEANYLGAHIISYHLLLRHREEATEIYSHDKNYEYK